jgi:transcription-repair coupling factor (superfamily II helicase)
MQRETAIGEKLRSFLSSLREKLELGERRISISGLWGAARAFVLTALQRQLDVPLLVICSTTPEAQTLADDLRFFQRVLPASSGVVLFPAWEVLPYEALSPSVEIVAQRIDTLHRLLYGERLTVVTTVAAGMQRLIPRRVLDRATELIGVGEAIGRDRVVQRLIEGGYRLVDMVEGRGEYSVRGGILDFWGPATEQPVRVEFFGDEIESIRLFDYQTQRSLKLVEEALILPSREALLTPEAIACFRKQVGSAGTELFQQLSLAQAFPGMEHCLGYLYPRLDSLFDYLAQDTLVVLDEYAYLKERAGEWEAQVAREYGRVQPAPYPPPADNYLSPDQLERKFRQYRTIQLDSLKVKPTGSHVARLELRSRSTTALRFTLQGRREEGGYMARLAEEIKGWQRGGEHVWLVCHNPGQAQRLQEILGEYELGSRVVEPGSVEPQSLLSSAVPLIWVGRLSTGFYLPDLGLRVITEAEIFGEAKKAKPRPHYKSSRFLSTLSDLKVDDYVVHVDHGIGLYRGLKKLPVDHCQRDFMLLEYAEGDKLYLPLERLHLVQKYMGGGEEQLRLNKLGTQEWARLKKRVKAGIKEMAEELIQLYASRQVVSGHAFSADTNWQREFEAGFEYEETPDQLRAIEEVKRDMEADRPMDRLICGDVGYGKTEVALRGAFKAVMEGKQVALLVPTTVLAQQHFNTFCQRLAPFPIRVEMLSRFKSPKERAEVVAGLRQGTVDIVIGTHRLLQRDICFKDLGLVIIDEEQHFGVAHKEKLKSLRRQVDVLTLTATPIPRTLHMALMGMRDMSIIDTPPEDRLDIHTEVLPFDNQVIREAILREMARGGQVFFVHNWVESIERRTEALRRLVPEARIALAHGQMRERVLEEVMLRFVDREYDVLVCTSIIESGLDISTANTIIIERADCFGLAQLYQLRGRVGRSEHRAYAYLLIPPGRPLSDTAHKRLQAIKELSQLGAGFRLAAHDLEIRGAGNILGRQQHGHIASVGFELYCQLVEEAISELRGQPKPERIEPQIELGIEARIPEDYIPDTNQRLNFYQKIAQAEHKQQLEAHRQEIEDRYGRLPPPVSRLLQVMDLRLLCQQLCITRIRRQGEQVRLDFSPSTPISPERVVSLIEKEKSRARLTPDNSLIFTLNPVTEDEICPRLKQLLEPLIAGSDV